MADKKKKGCLGAAVGVIILGVIIAAVAGSGSDKDDSSSQTDGKVSVSSSSESQPQGKVSSSSDDSDKSSDEKSNDEKTDDEKTGDGEVKEEVNQVVFDDKNIKITYTGYEAAKVFDSASLNFLIENNSDKNLTLSDHNFNVNGFTIDGLFYEEVPAGKKSNAKLEIASYDLKNNGIDTLGTVDFQLRGIDSDSYDEIFLSDNISIIFDESAVKEEDLSNYQLVNEQGGVSVYYKGCDQDGIIEEAKFNFLIVNESGKNVYVSADNVSVNDFAIIDTMYAECSNAKKTNDYISVYTSDLKDNGIEKIEKLEFTLACVDSDSYDRLWETEPITITLE